MAEEEYDEEEEEAQPQPVEQPSPLRYLPLVLVVLLLQAGGAYFLIDYRFPSSEKAPAGSEDDEGRRRVEVPEGSEPETSVDLGDIIVNPRGTEARLLLVAQVTLGVWPKAVKAEIESELNKDRVKDAVHAVLSNATPGELRTLDGRDEVKSRIMEDVNAFLYEGQVVKVYFGQFIRQALPGYKGGE